MENDEKKPNIFERITIWLATKAEEHSDVKPTRKMPVDKEIERIKRKIPGTQ
jgi:hypothetical protein